MLWNYISWNHVKLAWFYYCLLYLKVQYLYLSFKYWIKVWIHDLEISTIQSKQSLCKVALILSDFGELSFRIPFDFSINIFKFNKKYFSIRIFQISYLFLQSLSITWFNILSIVFNIYFKTVYKNKDKFNNMAKHVILIRNNSENLFVFSYYFIIFSKLLKLRNND